MSDASNLVLDIKNLTKHFPLGGLRDDRKVHAVDDVTFTIPRTEIVTLVGESGSGKSTTARLISRLIEPTTGEIRYNGTDVLKSQPGGANLAYRGDVQMVFQDPFGSLNPAHTIGYHIERPLLIHKKVSGRKELKERVYELLDTVGLGPAKEVAERFPYELSGGQRQRVGFARALSVEPKVILADEPVSMLDVSIRVGVLNLMKRLAEDSGLSFLYITHDIASARYISDHTNVMYAGRMVEGAASDELVHEPAHPYTRLLLSAVPNPHAGLRTEAMQARGEIPSLIDPPPGCPFAGRCPHVMPVCREIMPAAVTIAKDHWVRCHLYGNKNAGPLSNMANSVG